MNFVEFIVFVCRVCHEAFEKTDKKKELLYLKIDYLMPKLLEPNKLVPLFSFKEKFQVDKKNEQRRTKRKMKKLMQAKSKAIA